jgi:hypothetical protein
MPHEVEKFDTQSSGSRLDGLDGAAQDIYGPPKLAIAIQQW